MSSDQTDKSRSDNTERRGMLMKAVRFEDLQTPQHNLKEVKESSKLEFSCPFSCSTLLIDQTRCSESCQSMSANTVDQRPSQLAVPTVQLIEGKSAQLSDSTVLTGSSDPSLLPRTPSAARRLNASKDVARKPVDISHLKVKAPQAAENPLKSLLLNFSRRYSGPSLTSPSLNAPQPPSNVTHAVTQYTASSTFSSRASPPSSTLPSLPPPRFSSSPIPPSSPSAPPHRKPVDIVEVVEQHNVEEEVRIEEECDKFQIIVNFIA
ncbi:unnamed protein product [Rodentolepis nana]|uniref:Flocculation protein FLO11-like n=1 Tax=Rodentolepis nana TaxID=102285 RepID=A0A0R3U099_RODNA|nr:unnamed protein product [Rodentolepis nana]